ncbi:acetyl-coenzyme A synthetase 2 [Marasmius tenuissimus]|uniref:acetate--CoA ligase n=1 Tax=Marasmius tenuissimus TaxID=585030 RepID=A0ABR2Z9G7_9AGAR
MKSEDPLFILYASGSTDKPKGVVYTTAGDLLCAALTVKNVFDVHPDDKFTCMADISWITGRIYIFYGPLAVRLLRRLGHQHSWYNEHVGRKECSIVDTFRQTETGPIVITPFPVAIPTNPGSATTPFFGHSPALLDATSEKKVASMGGEGGKGYRVGEVERGSWRPYHFTGDGAAIDKDGYIWIKDRVDDVINVSGHRMSAAEIESAFIMHKVIMHKGVAETAVIRMSNELTGQAVVGFVTMKP